MILFYGTITSIHGLRGEVELAFRDIGYFASLPIIEINTSVYVGGKSLLVLDIKRKPKALVVSFDNIDNVQKARDLVGKDLYVDTDLLPELDNNTFYEAELIGFKIVDLSDELYAIVTDCYSLPSNSVLVLKLIDGEEVSVPFVSKYFGKISREKKTIEIIIKPSYD